MRTLLVALVACSPAPHAVADAGPCGADRFVTGELVDWDSSDARFCGVFGATLEVHGDVTRRDETNPNGRFELCAPAAPLLRIDVTPPSDPSECTPATTYAAPATLIVPATTLDRGALISARLVTLARAPAFGVDAAKATGSLSIAGTRDPPQLPAALAPMSTC
jgi:hypothetical protein